LLTTIDLAVADDGWWNVDHGGYWSTSGNWLNVIIDQWDIDLGTSEDANGNGAPDECE